MKRTLQIFFAAITVAFLVGCGTLGLPAATDFNEKVVAASGTVKAVAGSAIQLRVAGKLSDAQRDRTVKACDAALDAIELAKGARQVDPVAAENRLALALAVITALQSYTANPNSGQAALDAALAALAALPRTTGAKS